MPEEGEFLTYFVKNYLFYNYYETNIWIEYRYEKYKHFYPK